MTTPLPKEFQRQGFVKRKEGIIRYDIELADRYMNANESASAALLVQHETENVYAASGESSPEL